MPVAAGVTVAVRVVPLVIVVEAAAVSTVVVAILLPEPALTCSTKAGLVEAANVESPE